MIHRVNFFSSIALALAYCSYQLVDSNSIDPAASANSNFASYNESCITEISQLGKLCNFMRNLTCQGQICNCSDQQGVLLVYLEHPEIQMCVPLPNSANNWTCNWDQQCQRSSLGKYSRCDIQQGQCECFDTESLRPTIRDHDICYMTKGLGDSCENDRQCNITINGEAICIGATEIEPGICECGKNDIRHLAQDGRFECIPLQGIGKICDYNIQCNHVEALGTLARCNERSRCECYDTRDHVDKDPVQYYVQISDQQGATQVKGKCYFVRKENETCSTSEECILGFHANSACLSHPSYNGETICQCTPGNSCKPGQVDSGQSDVAAVKVSISIISYMILPSILNSLRN